MSTTERPEPPRYSVNIEKAAWTLEARGELHLSQAIKTTVDWSDWASSQLAALTADLAAARARVAELEGEVAQTRTSFNDLHDTLGADVARLRAELAEARAGKDCGNLRFDEEYHTKRLWLACSTPSAEGDGLHELIHQVRPGDTWAEVKAKVLAHDCTTAPVPAGGEEVRG